MVAVEGSPLAEVAGAGSGLDVLLGAVEVARALPRVAARIATKIRKEATSHTGEVPPIEVTATPAAVRVTLPDWSMRIARDKSQPGQWADIVAEEVREAAKGR